MERAEIESLLERVRSATGPDRELDAAIAVALPPDGEERMPLNGYSASQGKFWSKTGYGEGSCTASSFTASVDAAVALIERVLPGWRITLIEMMSNWQAHLNLADASGFVIDDVFEDGATAPLALLAALLLALLHQASDKEMIDADA